jgi:hypothetical protein
MCDSLLQSKKETIPKGEPKSSPKLGFFRVLGAVTLEALRGSPSDASKEAVSIGFVRGLEVEVDRRADFGQYSTVFSIL